MRCPGRAAQRPDVSENTPTVLGNSLCHSRANGLATLLFPVTQ